MLKDIFRFIRFLNKYQAVERSVPVPDREILENDVEHSYQLAMIAWYVVDRKKLKLSKERIWEYSLAHDLVEVYAGDTDAHTASEEEKQSKEGREHVAFEKIKEEFPGFASLHKVIERYERREDDESKLVYVLDKILPVMNVYIASDDYYVRNGVTHEKYVEWLKGKIQNVSMSVLGFEDLVEELLVFLDKKRKGFFK
ncbi:hypothetical protein CL629_02395 [bacterium]|nr:hypothetical protein [bacterium]|tara:strand:+ start:3651 stop:4244 length:594 start_codon:yes stop_codon:yes gene_type:complete